MPTLRIFKVNDMSGTIAPIIEPGGVRGFRGPFRTLQGVGVGLGGAAP